MLCGYATCHGGQIKQNNLVHTHLEMHDLFERCTVHILKCAIYFEGQRFIPRLKFNENNSFDALKYFSIAVVKIIVMLQIEIL